MISIKHNIEAEKVLFGGEHILFVEGQDGNSIDPEILKELLENSIRIEPLGASYSVKSVAEALHPHHPLYYFLIDRDHHQDKEVEKSWANFPNPDTHNLLIWRRREIENYFLDPEYLLNSQYCQVDREELERKILELSQARLFLDAANHVIISVREELKKEWIKIFKKPDEFSSKEKALEKLANAEEFEKHASKTQRLISPDVLREKFNECLELMTGGESQLTFETGRWLSMVRGKPILSQVIHSECFQVAGVNGVLNGKEKLNAIIKDLLRKDENILPPDFSKLKQLINERLNSRILG